ncbi:pyruvate decarboxylase [Fusarium pseudoanthophilum]|uniref:Pyruvate decarboxylase n=1 Tax=Fusarium pseudoanthophilum TaxID=48495 RepID=A0A8H5PN49_9HYPO|nr:pyruvate decarboxylase [Fusarium pseudoanthophilum]
MTHTKEATVPLGEYLFTRLKQLEIGSIFGVPGDYNLRLLDYIKPTGIKWIGNCNELNAAYSADGYSRIQGLSAVITTFGVGELSAINGIAGAYSERAPVIHIVGAPSRTLQSARALVHHTFLDGEYGRFAEMHRHVTAAQTCLTDVQTAADKIDWIIEQAMIHQRPVYLQIPDDLVSMQVSTANFEKRPVIRPAPSAAEINAETVDKILQRIYSATKPLLYVDGESRSIGAIDEINKLINTTNWPTWTTAFGKGLINEELPNVHGVYLAEDGDKESLDYFKSSDLILFFGPHMSNINTGIFKAIPEESVTVSFSPGQIKVGGQLIRDVDPRQYLQSIVSQFDSSKLAKVESPAIAAKAPVEPSPSDALNQAEFYRYVNPMFRRGDIVLTETGTAATGGKAFKLPQDCRYFTCVTWLSIGYMLPATLGAALAQRDVNGSQRAVLFIGDGSLQMTAQEISTMVKQKLNVIIFVINNNGYTIERAIHGRNADYNDISPWNHQHALGLFGLSQEEASKRYFSAKTFAELRTAMDSKAVQDSEGVTMIEVFMGQEDCTGELKELLDRQMEREKSQ